MLLSCASRARLATGASHSLSTTLAPRARLASGSRPGAAPSPLVCIAPPLSPSSLLLSSLSLRPCIAQRFAGGARKIHKREKQLRAMMPKGPGPHLCVDDYPRTKIPRNLSIVALLPPGLKPSRQRLPDSPVLHIPPEHLRPGVKLEDIVCRSVRAVGCCLRFVCVLFCVCLRECISQSC